MKFDIGTLELRHTSICEIMLIENENLKSNHRHNTYEAQKPLRKSKKDYPWPLYPKKTKRGGVCYDRDWHPVPGMIRVVKPKNPYRDLPSALTVRKGTDFQTKNPVERKTAESRAHE